VVDKIMIYVVIAAVIGGAGWLFNHQITARVHAETRATQAELAQELAEREVDRIETALQAETVRANDLQIELDDARVVETEATAVLQDRQRLETLTAARPGLLEIRAQKATTSVWETIEREANEPQ